MFGRNSVVWFQLLAMSVPVSKGASSTQEFKNAQVIVTEETLAPGEKAPLPHGRPCMLVFLTGNTADFVPHSGEASAESVSRGVTLFEPPGEESIRNGGDIDLSFVRVEFLDSGSSENWGMAGLPKAYKLLFENRYARAYDIKIRAQSFEPQHTHHARVVICLAGAELEHILPSGEHQPSTLKTGEVTWRSAATHTGHNIGHTDLWAIAIEPK